MDILYSIFIFFFGTTLISFYLVVGTRLPKKMTLMGRSMCDACQHELRFIDVVPIIGFLINKGRCHFCNKKIHLLYPSIEVLGGFLFVFFFLKIGFSFELFIAFTLLSVLIIETVSDLFYHIVIDRVWMIGFIIILTLRIVQANVIAYLLSSIILFLGLFLLGWGVSKLYKKEALGGGDIKLYAMIGLAINIYNGLLSLFLASLLALIYAVLAKKTKSYIPLVPFISIATIIVYLYGENIIQWYLSLFGM